MGPTAPEVMWRAKPATFSERGTGGNPPGTDSTSDLSLHPSGPQPQHSRSARALEAEPRWKSTKVKARPNA